MSFMAAYRTQPRGMWESAAMLFDFMSPGVLPDDTTLTRASTGWYFNSSGVLVSAANDVGRWSYNPTTLTLLGLLNEPAETNSLRNASMLGAVTGTPGTVPTNWSITSSVNGLTRQIVETGTDNGIPYIDIKWSGTPTASATLQITFEGNTAVAALNNQIWQTGVFVKIVAGSLTNITQSRINLSMRNSGGTQVGSFPQVFVMTGAELNTQYISLGNTLNVATTAFINSFVTIGYTNGQAIDLTMRIGLPQLAQSAESYSSIITTTIAVTRATDIVTLLLAAGTYNIQINRVSGITLLPGTVVGGSGFEVPTSGSPLQKILTRAS